MGSTRKREAVVGSLPAKMYWPDKDNEVNVIGPGHFPDTVVVESNKVLYEVRIADLKDSNYGR